MSQHKNGSTSSTHTNWAETLLPADNFSRLAAHSKIKGDLYFDSDVYFQGELEGTIVVKGEHTSLATVGEGAKIVGEIRVQKMIISGTIQGEIFASESVEITHLGNVTGHIHAPKLIVQTGAVFNGQSHLLKG